MADHKLHVHLNLLQNEIQNARLQSLAVAPSAPKEGQFYWNTASDKMFIYNGEEWIDVGSTYTLPIATSQILGGIKVGNTLNIDNIGILNANTASTTVTGIIRIATDNEFETGTSTTLAVTPKQIQQAIADFITLEDLSSTATGLTYNNATGVFSLTSGYKIPTTTEVGQIETNKNDITDINTTLGTFGDIVTHDVDEFATAAQGEKADTALQPSDIINNTTSTATDKALSANMGKSLQDQINNLLSRGKYLSIWDCTTGLAMDEPPINPYTYENGSYFIVGKVASAGGTNYKPNGATYDKDVPSTTVETGAVRVNDTYYYESTSNTWRLLDTPVTDVAFSSIAGDPYDNTNLADALNAKVTGNNAITGATKAVVTYDSKGLVTAGRDLQVSDIPALPYNKKIVASNPSLIPSGGVVTWTISNTLGTADVVCSIKEISSGEEIYANVTYSTSNVVIKINTSSNIPENSYKAVIVG